MDRVVLRKNARSVQGISIRIPNRNSLGAIQKVCHRPRGGGGSSKMVTKSDKGGRGVKQNSDVTAY